MLSYLYSPTLTSIYDCWYDIRQVLQSGIGPEGRLQPLKKFLPQVKWVPPFQCSFGFSCLVIYLLADSDLRLLKQLHSHQPRPALFSAWCPQIDFFTGSTQIELPFLSIPFNILLLERVNRLNQIIFRYSWLLLLLLNHFSHVQLCVTP